MDSVMRHLLRQRVVADGREAMRVLSLYPAHVFWADEPGYEIVDWVGVTGHRQVTDAHLVALARHHGGRVAMLDEGFAALHDDIVELIPC